MYPDALPDRRFPDQHVRADDGDRLPGRLVDHGAADGGGGLDPDLATTLLIYVMLGGIFGSKLYYAIDVSLREGRPFSELFFARDGITWYGGLIGGTLVGAIGCRGSTALPVRHGRELRRALAGAVGQALGRIGCFLVGDDYGRPTDAALGRRLSRRARRRRSGARAPDPALRESSWLLPVAASCSGRAATRARSCSASTWSRTASAGS